MYRTKHASEPAHAITRGKCWRRARPPMGPAGLLGPLKSNDTDRSRATLRRDHRERRSITVSPTHLKENVTADDAGSLVACNKAWGSTLKYWDYRQLVIIDEKLKYVNGLCLIPFLTHPYNSVGLTLSREVGWAQPAGGWGVALGTTLPQKTLQLRAAPTVQGPVNRQLRSSGTCICHQDMMGPYICPRGPCPHRKYSLGWCIIDLRGCQADGVWYSQPHAVLLLKSRCFPLVWFMPWQVFQ